jgi:hypothetical protein
MAAVVANSAVAYTTYFTKHAECYEVLMQHIGSSVQRQQALTTVV